ncbi:hypothetical protein [Paenibacillus tepidiphilus]|uniref:hypothetical protein n=1 Tax=Paenibacillus tepidiphilus TaxID=2608683 RepID=UPI00123ADE61|nr:hypothetical protein [Paenibacillus tepidiphilus]
MKIFKWIGIGWIILLAIIVMFAQKSSSNFTHLKNSQQVTNPPISSQFPQVIAVIPEEGPLEEDHHENHAREKLEDVVGLFLDLINKGDLESAGTFIDGNYMLDLMAKDKPANQGKYIEEYVHLFEPGELVKFSYNPPTETSRNMSCIVNLHLSGKREIRLQLGLQEMTDEHTNEKLWYFTTIEEGN